MYKRLYWIIELEIIKANSDDERFPKIINRQVMANLAEENLDAKRYITRSVAAKEKLLESMEVNESKIQTDNFEKDIGDGEGIVWESLRYVISYKSKERFRTVS